LVTILRSRTFVALLICGVLTTVSVCPTRCLAAQLHRSAKNGPCHGDAPSPRHAALALLCCPAPVVVQVAFHAPQIVAADLVVVQSSWVHGAPAIRFEASPRAVQHSPPVYVLHRSLLI